MRAEHLHQWLISENKEDAPDTTNWQNVVAIVQVAFRDGTLAEECMWQTVIFIPKGKSGNFREIGLVGVIWKIMYSLMKRRITGAITFHDVLHGLRTGRGTETATLEAKLL